MPNPRGESLVGVPTFVEVGKGAYEQPSGIAVLSTIPIALVLPNHANQAIGHRPQRHHPGLPSYGGNDAERHRHQALTSNTPVEVGHGKGVVIERGDKPIQPANYERITDRKRQ